MLRGLTYPLPQYGQSDSSWWWLLNVPLLSSLKQMRQMKFFLLLVRNSQIWSSKRFLSLNTVSQYLQAFLPVSFFLFRFESGKIDDDSFIILLSFFLILLIWDDLAFLLLAAFISVTFVSSVAFRFVKGLPSESELVESKRFDKSLLKSLTSSDDHSPLKVLLSAVLGDLSGESGSIFGSNLILVSSMGKSGILRRTSEDVV